MKFGIIVASHGNFAREAVETIKNIIGDIEGIETISVEFGKNLQEIQQQFEKLVNRMLKKYKHVLIFTDMFGGTPSNISFGFVKPEKVEMITGFNLPMLIKAAKMSMDEEEKPLHEIVLFLANYGKDNVKIASKALT